MAESTSLLDYHLLTEAYRKQGELQNATIEDIAICLNNSGGHSKKKIQLLVKQGVFKFAHYTTIAGKIRKTYSFDIQGWENNCFHLNIVRCAVAHIVNKTGRAWVNMHSPYTKEEMKQILEEFRLEG